MLKDMMVLGISELSEEPYASVLCYPKLSKMELQKRLNELEKLNVDALVFSGEKRVLDVSVLGKGCVGIVTVALRKKARIALKIRRVDADRSGMQREAELLGKANSVNVGPRLLDVSDDFLLMEYIEGDLLPKWLEKAHRKIRVRKVFHELLEQCFRLDMAGLDHGELSHAPKHVIIREESEPFIVDFETASLARRPANVVSICQFLFIGGIVAGQVSGKLGGRNKEVIIGALKRYKNNRNRENFEAVLRICGL